MPELYSTLYSIVVDCLDSPPPPAGHSIIDPDIPSTGGNGSLKGIFIMYKYIHFIQDILTLGSDDLIEIEIKKSALTQLHNFKHTVHV